MKFNKLALALALSAPMFAAQATEAPAQALLQWTGFVGGSFDSSTIGLTGQGGGDITPATITIQADGTFSSDRAIVVEAHQIDPKTKEVKTDLFGDGVDWNLSAVNINHPAYDSSKLAFTANGKDFVPGTVFSTNSAISPIVGIAVAAETSAVISPDLLKAGDAVQVSATILAEPVLKPR
ncbi:hypothetical protein [Photobacterium damselae]|uniref:hypothetical protein n=1 Tax=Photobacterium damselae TaxID=38293 RepID=UPI001593240B|nr:hypothetical protein [Photobacterium damselae]NVH47963.1 hypothetical protein [Photobacterium damselae subsp. damselae]